MLAVVALIDANADKAPKLAILHLLTIVNNNQPASALAAIAVMTAAFESCKPRFRNKLAESKVIWKEIQRTIHRQDIDSVIRDALVATIKGWTTVPDKKLATAFEHQSNEALTLPSSSRVLFSGIKPTLSRSGSNVTSPTVPDAPNWPLSPTQQTQQLSSGDTVIQLAQLASSLEPFIRTLSDLSAAIETRGAVDVTPDAGLVSAADSAAARCQEALEEVNGIMRRNQDRVEVLTSASACAAELEGSLKRYERVMTVVGSPVGKEGAARAAAWLNLGREDETSKVPPSPISTASGGSSGSVSRSLSGSFSASAVSTAPSAVGGESIPAVTRLASGTIVPNLKPTPGVPNLTIDPATLPRTHDIASPVETPQDPLPLSPTGTTDSPPSSELRLALPNPSPPTTPAVTTPPANPPAPTASPTTPRNTSPSRPRTSAGGGIVFRSPTPESETPAETRPQPVNPTSEPTPRSSTSSNGAKRPSLEEFGYDVDGKESRPKNSHVNDFMRGQNSFLGPKKWGEKKLGKLPEGFVEAASAASARKSGDAKRSMDIFRPYSG
ncbi:hypothetical protein M427DRAFT_130645 [Gonapodya prolifera JEL478]|uniref:VHS domain-containing protein n=1 Tax=Gonapodya prolifera (strain JEL478) TaxID=1344416 RepID=A0A139AZ53_GONPJ|nr:hypothetical protein M427DRAFT_130645 [Gonapodya prolifera JEL478]|eukprot:KXS21984.1 hypothetical protein M427DRAFT_130645 [Gonapodya prolifera JEL478]